jgi:hypothetical protein
MIRIVVLIVLIVLCAGSLSSEVPAVQSLAQTAVVKNRNALPTWMQKIYLEALPSYLHYPFSIAQLNPGFSANDISIPHLSLRIGLAYQFSPFISAKLSYLLPAGWVNYSVNASDNQNAFTRPVWMNYAGTTLNGHIPLSTKVEALVEAGSVFITRKGFSTDAGVPVINHATYFSWLAGVGMRYIFHPSWSVVASAGVMPRSVNNNQPRTTYAGVGLRFSLSSTGGVSYVNSSPMKGRGDASAEPGLICTKGRGVASAETGSESLLLEGDIPLNSGSSMFHPHQWLQIGYSGNQAGYGVNNFISRDLGIFWGGRLQIDKAMMVQFQRNIFHTNKWFAIDWGLNAAFWVPEPSVTNSMLSVDSQTTKVSDPEGEATTEVFYTLSIYPVFRLNFLQTKLADLYFFYSVAGPSFISKSTINGIDLGRKFIFTDTMGFGAFAGKNRKFAFEVRIGHFSNGNMFPSNPGVKVPLTFLAGIVL